MATDDSACTTKRTVFKLPKLLPVYFMPEWLSVYFGILADYAF